MQSELKWLTLWLFEARRQHTLRMKWGKYKRFFMWKMCELEMPHIVLETKMHFSLQSFFIQKEIQSKSK